MDLFQVDHVPPNFFEVLNYIGSVLANVSKQMLFFWTCQRHSIRSVMLLIAKLRQYHISGPPLEVNSISDAALLQNDLTKLNSWSTSSGLTFNQLKCKCLHVTRKIQPLFMNAPSRIKKYQQQ